MVSGGRLMSIVVALSELLVHGVTAAADVVTRRGYADGRFGQVHYRMARPAAGEGARPR
jgi:hypothetical protein